MQLRPIYNNFLKELKLIYDPNEAEAITHLIFEELACFSKASLITEPNKEVNPQKNFLLENALHLLKQNKPVQYVIGHTWFYQLKFKVNEAVLIPRPETEELVSEVISFINIHHKKNCLDIGTGSGCIPISIKKNIPALNISAMDVSLDALKVAKENAAFHHTQINFLHHDFLNESKWPALENFDVIVSNPPYIPIVEKTMLASNVADNEPALALFVPTDDPLLFYRKIAAFAKTNLNNGGAIFMETHVDYAQDVAQLFTENGFKATVKKDFFENDRIVIANLSH